MTPPGGLLEQLEFLADGRNWVLLPSGSSLDLWGEFRAVGQNGGALLLDGPWPSGVAQNALVELATLSVQRALPPRITGERPSWDEYYLGIAQAVSARASCNRLQVGSVLVNDRAILSTGYNGSIRGLPSCYDVGCDMVEGHCSRTVHSEINALAHAADHGAAIHGSTLYCNYGPPCWGCFRVLANAGVQRYVYGKGYAPDPRVSEAAAALGLRIEQIGACP